MNPHYLYLTVDLAVLAIPLLCSFDRKVRFVRFWPALFPAIAVMMALFILLPFMFLRERRTMLRIWVKILKSFSVILECLLQVPHLNNLNYLQ